MLKQEKYRNTYKKYLAADGDEHSIDKYYTFDEKGHIMVVTTSHDTDNIAPAVREMCIRDRGVPTRGGLMFLNGG